MLIIHALPTTYAHATTKSAVVTALIASGNSCVYIYIYVLCVHLLEASITQNADGITEMASMASSDEQ